MTKIVIRLLCLLATTGELSGISVDNDNYLHFIDNAQQVGSEMESKWWCAAKVASFNDDNVDSNNAIQVCCQKHNECADNMQPNQEKHGLYNAMKYVATDCGCNKRFVNCLKLVDTSSALRVYNQYILDVLQCFKVSKQIKKCKEVDILKNCIKYEFSASGIRKHQWFDHYFSVIDNDGVLGNVSPNERTAINNLSGMRVMNQPHNVIPEEPAQQFMQYQYAAATRSCKSSSC